MIKIILFDLDGTLLPIDTDQFVAGYIRQLSAYVSHLIDPKTFVKELFASTEAMIRNLDPHRTNKEVFDEDFYAKLGKKEEFVPVIDRFYEEEFPKLSSIVKPYPFTPHMIKTLKERGYRAAIATNPLFPESAIHERIKWTGASPEDFDWITTYENSHFTKPNLEYYRELVEWLEVDPKEVLMVGNDVQEDLVAQKLGMKTYLITDKVIDRGAPQYVPDRKGSMETFYQELVRGEGLFS